MTANWFLKSSSDANLPIIFLYPVPFNSEVDKAKRYISDIPDGIFSIGRNGKYDYVLDIDDSINDAMNVAKDL